MTAGALSWYEALRLQRRLRALDQPLRLRDRAPTLLFWGSFALYWLCGQLIQEFHGHEAWNYFFSADCPRILHDMTRAQNGTSGYAASVAHPLFVLLTNLPTTLLARALGGTPLFAALLACHAAMAASVALFYSILRRVELSRAFAVVAACTYACSSSSLVFGSILETYAFVPLALFTLVLLGLRRHSWRTLFAPACAAVVPFGLNVVLAPYSLFATPVLLSSHERPAGFLRKVLGFWSLLAAAALTALLVQHYFYPDTNVADPSGFKAYGTYYSGLEAPELARQRRILVLLHFLAYEVVAPLPRLLASERTSTFMWFSTDVPPSYGWLGWTTLSVWLVALLVALTTLLARLRSLTRSERALTVLCAGWLAGTAFFFTHFGDDLMLYSEFWSGHVLLLAALGIGKASARSRHSRAWFLAGLAFAALLLANNARFVAYLVRQYHGGSWLSL